MVLLKNANHTLPLKTNHRHDRRAGSQCQRDHDAVRQLQRPGTPEHQVTILDGIKQAVGADHVITTTNLQVPLTGNIALAEPVKADYLFTDASKSKHGLTVAYAANAAWAWRSRRRQKCPKPASSRCRMLPAASPLIPRMAAKMTGVLVPPVTGEYQLGAKGRDAFRLSIDGKVVVDEMQGGALRLAGTPFIWKRTRRTTSPIEFSHSAATSGRGGRGGRGLGGGFGGRGPGRGAPGAATSNSPAALRAGLCSRQTVAVAAGRLWPRWPGRTDFWCHTASAGRHRNTLG